MTIWQPWSAKDFVRFVRRSVHHEISSDLNLINGAVIASIAIVSVPLAVVFFLYPVSAAVFILLLAYFNKVDRDDWIGMKSEWFRIDPVETNDGVQTWVMNLHTRFEVCHRCKSVFSDKQRFISHGQAECDSVVVSQIHES